MQNRLQAGQTNTRTNSQPTTRQNNRRYNNFYYCLFEVSVNHLFEDSTISMSDLRKNWQIEINPGTRPTDSSEVFKKILYNGKKGFIVGKLVSKYDMYNSMAKSLKQKIRQKAENSGYTHSLGHILEVLKRYMPMCMQVPCKLCGKLARFNAQTICLEYPVINVGINFIHPSCYNDPNINRS